MLAAYMAAAKLEGSETEMQAMSSQVRRLSRPGSSRMSGTTVVGIVALIVALGLGAVWLREHRRESGCGSQPGGELRRLRRLRLPPVAPVATAGTTGERGGQQPALRTGRKRDHGQAVGGTELEAPAKPGVQAAPVEVSISATKRAWISVRSDGKKVESVTLDPDKPGLSSRN